MTVAITFEPAHLTGLVAEGISLLDAAKRMGVRLPAPCTKQEDCMSCIIIIDIGAALLSPPSDTEQKLLDEGLMTAERRLACHAIIERNGDLMVTIPDIDESAKKQEPLKEVRKAFGELPLEKKLAALVQLEAVTMSEALDVIKVKTMSVGGKIVGVVARKAKSVKESRSGGRGPSANRPS